MRRRTFIAGLASSVAWPVVARAQQSERVRRIGVLWAFSEIDPMAKSIHSAFTRGLAELGWIEGRNVRIDFRWAGASVDRARAYAKELVGLQPDAILADSTPQTAAIQRETSTIPIVFVMVSDPVGFGFVAGVPRPGGNITGFAWGEPTMGGKWLELLTEIAPAVRRVVAIFNPDTAPYVASYYLPSFDAAARSFKVVPSVVPVHTDAEIEMVMTSLGREPKGGLVVMPDNFVIDRREAIISLAAQYKVPAVYSFSSFSRDGGLLSYGPDQVDPFRRATTYVDRILRGEKPAELPVQYPTKFETAVNLKTAKALGLTVPQSILLRADEVIE
jgi:putative tryptophan/tyrosine transport system substrate-binding protein